MTCNDGNGKDTCYVDQRAVTLSPTDEAGDDGHFDTPSTPPWSPNVMLDDISGQLRRYIFA